MDELYVLFFSRSSGLIVVKKWSGKTLLVKLLRSAKLNVVEAKTYIEMNFETIKGCSTIKNYPFHVKYAKMTENSLFGRLRT